MPKAAVNIVGSRAVAKLSRVAAHDDVPLLRLKVPDGAREEPGGDQIQEARRNDKKQVDLHHRASLENRVSHSDAKGQTGQRGEGDGSGGRREREAGYEDDALDALAQDRDEGQEEERVLLGQALQPALARVGLDRRLEGLGEFVAPFVLHLADAQQGDAHDGDDEGGEEREGALVVVLVGGPGVAAVDVEDADDGAGDE